MSKSTAKNTPEQPIAPVLPTIGRGKWSKIEPFIGICRESARKLTLVGKFPRPTRLSATCALYDFAEVHRWLADPAGYAAPIVEQDVA